MYLTCTCTCIQGLIETAINVLTDEINDLYLNVKYENYPLLHV